MAKRTSPGDPSDPTPADPAEQREDAVGTAGENVTDTEAGDTEAADTKAADTKAKDKKSKVRKVEEDKEEQAREPRGPLFVGLRAVLVPVGAVALVALLTAAALLAAFNSASPHKLPIGVTGGEATVAAVAKQLASGEDPPFTVEAVPEGTLPAEVVKSRDVYAVLNISDKAWQMTYAGANGGTVNSYLNTALRPPAAIAFSVRDAAPTAKGDPFAWSVCFLVLAAAVAGVVVGVVLGYRPEPLDRSTTFAALGLFAVIGGVVTTLMVRYLFDALDGGVAVPAVLVVLLMFVISALSLALTRVARFYGVAVAALLFIGVGTAFSGSLLPRQFLPTASSFLVDVLPNGLAAQAATGASYFEGDSGTTGIGGLVVWAVIGAAVVVLVDRRAGRSTSSAS